MNEWRVIFATVVIFGTGVVTGGLLVSHVDQSHFHGGAAHKAANPNNAAAGPNLDTNGAGPIFRVSEILNKPSFLNNLDTRLTKEKQALSLEQRKSIEAAIAEGQKEMRQLVQTVNQSVRQELTPEQRKKYDEMLKSPGRGKEGKHPAATDSPAAPVVVPPTNSPAASTNGAV